MSTLGLSSSQLKYPNEGSALLPLNRKSSGQCLQPNIPISKTAKAKAKISKKNKSSKLGTFSGVFLPTSLNVLSILMFLRFGFIIGQMGIAGTFCLLILSYTIDILTTMSISAISTNGTVKGGGAYFMISRSLGPEFGGAIGIIFFIGQILNSSLNVVGFIEPLLVNFGRTEGDVLKVLPVGFFWQFLYSSILLALCTCVAMVGSKLVSKTAFWLFLVLTMSTLSIPLSTLFVKPFYPLPEPYDDFKYTGLSWSTFIENLWPHFTSGAAGSVQPPGEPETFKNLFGIFFPATAGIFAGASMSGELRSPSKSIPEGTLKGLLVTFILYSLVIISMGCSIPRDLLHADIKIVQTVNIHRLVIILGELSTSLFSVIMGIVGAATMLSAIADDRIIPGLSVFTTLKKSPNEKKAADMLSIIVTWFIAQVFLFADINQIATFITMAFLMTFIVTNLACFLLKVGSAPNFRPSFRYFSSKTAFTGVLACIIAMFIVDGISATLIICFLMFLIMMIHYSAPPSKFGDISQLLIYHQVRKYLLRLKLQMSVKYWRPQILLLCDDPRTSWNLIGFCNHLKKGGLYILGHVVLMNDDTSRKSDTAQDEREFCISTYKEIQKQKQAWIQLRELSKIKAFVQIALGPTLPWGVRNVYLGSGLGGMRPNITVLGFYDFVKHGVELPLVPAFDSKTNLIELPTDECRKERKVSINQWVQIVEDLIIMQATVAVTANFGKLDLPQRLSKQYHFWSKSNISHSVGKRKYIDLYPIQMSSIDLLDDGKSVLSTNFDTYTLILQLGSILSTVPEWKYSSHNLRVIAFVEAALEVEDERARLKELLSNLRIDAEVKIICLDDGSLNSYNILVKGYSKTLQNKTYFEKLDNSLREDQWWKNLCDARNTFKEIEKQRLARRQKMMNLQQQKSNNQSKSTLSFCDKPVKKFSPLNLNSTSPKNSSDINESIPLATGLKNNRRYTLSNLHEQGLSLSFNMKTQNAGSFFNYDDPFDSSSSSESEKDERYESEVSEYNFEPDSHLYHSPSPLTKVDSGKLSDSEQEYQSIKPQRRLLKPKDVIDKSFTHSGTTSVDQLSIRSSRSNLRPNFLSYKIPQSQINDDENEGDDENKPSIGFVEEEENRNFDDDEDDIDEISENNDDKYFRTGKQKQNKSERDYVNYKLTESMQSKRGAFSKRIPEKALKSPTIITNTDDIIQQMRTPQFLAADDDDYDYEQIPSLNSSAVNLNKMDEKLNKSQINLASGSANSRSEVYKNLPKLPGGPEERKITQKQLQEELNSLSFNDLPAKGQHIILNELMKTNSPIDETDVIFSTLPAPSIGTHLDDNDSFHYTNNLAIWLDDLAPILLLNSQTVTVTTAL